MELDVILAFGGDIRLSMSMLTPDEDQKLDLSSVFCGEKKSIHMYINFVALAV